MTQKEKVLNHLKEYGQITSMEAFERYKITRVGAVIDILRKEGYEIVTEKPKKGNYGIYKLLGTKHNPKKRTLAERMKDKYEMSFEQGELGIAVKVKKDMWPD